jgi:nicotinamide mononucleotide transporter
MVIEQVTTLIGSYLIDNKIEILAVVSGIISVWMAKKESIWLYPIGSISVSLWIYLCWIGFLYGQSIINMFFLIMNLYGWYNWSRKNVDNQKEIIISKNSKKQNLKVIVSAVILSIVVYFCLFSFQVHSKLFLYVALESFITALNFIAMWLMAWKKVENWILWIIGDILCIPLFIHQEYYLSVAQFSIFIVIAYLGYKEWKCKLIDVK